MSKSESEFLVFKRQPVLSVPTCMEMQSQLVDAAVVRHHDP